MIEQTKKLPFWTFITGCFLIVVGVIFKMKVPDNVDLCKDALCNGIPEVSNYVWGVPIKIFGEGLLLSLLLFLFPFKTKIKFWHIALFAVVFLVTLFLLENLYIYPPSFLF